MTLVSRDPQLDQSYECPACGEDIHYNNGPFGRKRDESWCERCEEEERYADEEEDFEDVAIGDGW